MGAAWGRKPVWLWRSCLDRTGAQRPAGSLAEGMPPPEGHAAARGLSHDNPCGRARLQSTPCSRQAPFPSLQHILPSLRILMVCGMHSHASPRSTGPSPAPVRMAQPCPAESQVLRQIESQPGCCGPRNDSPKPGFPALLKVSVESKMIHRPHQGDRLEQDGRGERA